MTPAGAPLRLGLRLGIFGGAFDPPHLAHLALARAALEQLALDELRIFPTGNAWHRQSGLSDAAHRLEMARIAFADVPAAVVDDRELRRTGPTYTIDTLRELKAAQPAAQLFLIMGEDQAMALTRWHEWQAIVQIAVICVAARFQGAGTESWADGRFPAKADTRLIRMPEMPESATEVRRRLAAGLEIGHLVAGGVARYIDQHHLYRTN